MQSLFSFLVNLRLRNFSLLPLLLNWKRMIQLLLKWCIPLLNMSSRWPLSVLSVWVPLGSKTPAILVHPLFTVFYGWGLEQNNPDKLFVPPKHLPALYWFETECVTKWAAPLWILQYPSKIKGLLGMRLSLGTSLINLWKPILGLCSPF